MEKSRNFWQVAESSTYSRLKEFAKTNRTNQTEAELIFWNLAKSSGLGEKCRRQYVIGRYIVDFFFRKSMLIVELDGGYHNEPEQKELDKNRQEWLCQMGYKVIRFTNDEVLCDADNVIKKVKQFINQ